MLPAAVYLDDVLLRPASLLRQTIVVLLDPGVDQSSLLQGAESQVGESRLGVSGGGGGGGGGGGLTSPGGLTHPC